MSRRLLGPARSMPFEELRERRNVPTRRTARPLLHRAFVSLVMFSTMLPASACLVTSEPNFQQQDQCQPFFRTSDATPPLAKVAVVDLTTTSEFRPSIPLASCALTTAYDGRVFLDGTIVPVGGIKRIDPTGDVDRQVDVVVSMKTASLGCHTVEIYASSKFADISDERVPANKDDLAYVVWYVDVTDGGAATHPIEECKGPLP